MKQFILFLILLLLPFASAWGQNDTDPSQSGIGTTQPGDGNCQDPTSATCVPQSAYPSGSNPGIYGGAGAQGNIGGAGLPGGAVPNAAYGTGNQPLTEPNYRDENALPNQTGYRQPGYQAVAPEPLTEFQKFVAETTGQVLPIFGARLFRQVPTTFAPVDQIPVPADAVVGPGDLLRIRIWGQVNFSADVRVDRSGEIYLPQIGPLHVAGVQYSDLDAQLRTSIGRVYRNFNVSAQLGQIRSIQIYVVGRARRPGTYTVSSLSTLVDALFASGGPALDGSLRHIQLKRAGKLVTDFDLYDLLVNGDKSADVKLDPGDVIYIPAAGPQVAALGSVKTPAIYEIRLPETVAQVLEQAAGVTNVAGGTQLSIERMQGGEGRAAEGIAFTPEGMAAPLRDGDILRVGPVVPQYSKTVTLRGNTANPGRYGWHAGMRLSELFPERAALLTRNYWWQRTRVGLPAPEFERDPSLERYRQPSEPETLPISPEEQERQRGIRQQYAQQQQLLDQRRREQAQGGGVNAQGFGDSGQVPGGADSPGAAGMSESTRNADGSYRTTPYGQEAAQTSATARRDVITENTANAQGLTDVTLPAPEIDWTYAVIERLDPQTLKTSLIPFDLGRLIQEHDAAQDLALEPGDVVTVFSQADIHVPVEQQTRLVRLEGEFLHAGVYSVKPGETLEQMVERAGGLSPGAYLFGSEFTRASVRAVQQRRLDEYIQDLQLQIERGVLATSSAASSSAADLASANVAGTEARELVARLKQIRASGRIVLSLRAFSQGAQALPPLKLEDGDTYYVPSVPSNISVIGAVYDQNSFVYTPGQHVRDYLHLAGGANRNADKRRPFVIRADGSVISQDQVGERKFGKIVIQPGDTIVISEKTFGPSTLRNVLNFTQLFSSLAVGSAILGTVL
jgi:protein involved in polysaccharide export with SLBB domain